MLAFSLIVNLAEVGKDLLFKKIRGLWEGNDDEIKESDIILLPTLPKNHKRVDVKELTYMRVH
jgi:hypothetical protein